MCFYQNYRPMRIGLYEQNYRKVTPTFVIYPKWLVLESYQNKTCGFLKQSALGLTETEERLTSDSCWMSDGD